LSLRVIAFVTALLLAFLAAFLVTIIPPFKRHTTGQTGR
jgi:hypothetical protein